MSTNQLENSWESAGDEGPGGGEGVTPPAPAPFYRKLVHGHLFNDDLTIYSPSRMFPLK
jgi:hypothetical protein